MGRWTAFFSLLCIALGIGLFYTFSPLTKELNQQRFDDAKEFSYVQGLILAGNAGEAVDALQLYFENLPKGGHPGIRWVEVAILAYEQLGDATHLNELFRAFPNSFKNHEEACLLVARSCLYDSDDHPFESARKLWKGRETKRVDWFFVDADRLLTKNQRKEAQQLLESQKFTGVNEAKRYVRLALLVVQNDLNQAWDHLTKALKHDPSNAEILIRRGQVLEHLGNPAAAQREYLTACRLYPENSMLLEQLGDFYRRYHRYQLALKTWEKGLSTEWAVDTTWLKAWFWGRVAHPLSFNWKTARPPIGHVQAFVEYLCQMKPNRYWDYQAFSVLEDGKNFLSTRQEAFWLRVIDHLQKGEETEALELLTSSPFRGSSYHRELEVQLLRILTFRKVGSFLAVMGDGYLETKFNIETFSESTFRHQLFKKINLIVQGNEKVSEDLQQLLLSDEVFSAAFLAAGWFEAALQLCPPSLSCELPGWYSLGITQALRLNRSNYEALAFATKQKETPELSLAIGEVLLDLNQVNSAIDRLGKLVICDSEVGMRASVLLCEVLINRNEFHAAKEILERQQVLAQALQGKELIARMAAMEGKVELADHLYSKIQNKSGEAQSYLARRAFLEKDWKRAKDLTQKLLKRYPTNTRLQENLDRIEAAERKEGRKRSRF